MALKHQRPKRTTKGIEIEFIFETCCNIKSNVSVGFNEIGSEHFRTSVRIRWFQVKTKTK